MIRERYLTSPVVDDLREKMVFIGGARQVGKTTLAKNLIARYFNAAAYLNWDNRTDRQKILHSEWPGDATLLIFDEIHKYRKWKTLIKGEYDTLKEKYAFLVTGSSRLDVYRRGGDSLQGRYHYYRLHPFTIAEILNLQNRLIPFNDIPVNSRGSWDTFLQADAFGGFPEPLLKQDGRVLRRWHNEKIERLFREDIQDMEMIRDLGSMKLLCDMLPERVSSFLSINSIREDLEVSHRAATHWINVLESFYYHYRIYPFVRKGFRSVKKEAKLYLWDWSEVKNEAARFENIIASHLLKLVHYLYDVEGYKADLHVLRDIAGKEIDFLVSIDGKPWFSVEVKLTDTEVSGHYEFFISRLSIPYAYQVVKKKDVDKRVRNIRVISADRFLAGLI